MNTTQLNRGNEIQSEITQLCKELDLANCMIAITDKRINVQYENDDKTLDHSFIETSLIDFDKFKEFMRNNLKGRIAALSLEFDAL